MSSNTHKGEQEKDRLDENVGEGWTICSNKIG